MGYNLLTKTWSRGVMEKQNKNNNVSDIGQAKEGAMGKQDSVEESEDERKWKNREERNVSSPAKETRSHSVRGVGE